MAKRQSVERPYNSGTMTAAERHSFIVSIIRGGFRKWKPKGSALKRSKIGWNQYKCEICSQIMPSKLPPKPGNKRKITAIQADHTIPCVGPEGFTTWDSFIDRMFVEADGLQSICHICHAAKTKGENEERRASNKAKLNT